MTKSEVLRYWQRQIVEETTSVAAEQGLSNSELAAYKQGIQRGMMEIIATLRLQGVLDESKIEAREHC